MCRPLVLLFAVTLFAARDFPPGQSLRFELANYFDDARYSWPRSLVSYPVNFDQGRIKPYALILTRMDTGERVPFQLSEVKSEYGYLVYAVVSFFADLPRGATRVYELGATSGGGEFAAGVREWREDESIVLDTSALRVRMPASRNAPALEIARGSVTWAAPRRVLVAEAARIESGPLFVTYQLHGRFDDGSPYAATIRATAGYDTILLREESGSLGVPSEFLERTRGPVDLNLYKDWLLEYPDGRRRPALAAESGTIGSVDELEAAVFSSGAPAAAWADAYSRFYRRMSERQKRRLTAWFLMMAYLDAVPGLRARVATLFPDHPMAGEWATEH